MASHRGSLRIGLAFTLAFALGGCSAVLSWSDSDLGDGGAGGDGGDDAMTASDAGDGAAGADAGLDGAPDDAPGIPCDLGNDSRNTPTLIAAPITVSGSLCRFGDHDFYQFSRPLGSGAITIRASFDGTLGDVDLRLYSQLGTVIAQAATPTGNSEQIMQPSVFGLSFFVEVYDDAEHSTAPYTLTFVY